MSVRRHRLVSVNERASNIIIDFPEKTGLPPEWIETKSEVGNRKYDLFSPLDRCDLCIYFTQLRKTRFCQLAVALLYDSMN